MSECIHDCASCGESCAQKEIPKLAPHPHSSIKRVIAVVSGKGGVGKSLVTAMLAVLANRNGFQTAVLDADVTGPSVPQAFGIHEKAEGTEDAILPAVTKTGLKLMSVNLLLEDATEPVVWRGPVIAGAVKQFWQDVLWENVDYLFIDMPPGTGDVPLTVFQSLPVDGIVIVTTPQELVSMIVGKAVKMAQMLHIPILGLVENMSYVECPHCGERLRIYGEGHSAEAAAQCESKLLAQIPVTPELAAQVDKGLIELFEGSWLDDAAEEIFSCLPV
ncbi:MAG: Mrp/NBP35 family ATP-binding protein [Oscillospiraceae bacterium]